MHTGYDQYDNRGHGPEHVVVTTPTNFTVVTNEKAWSWCTLVTSAISLFCCQCFGVPSLILAILSYVDHRVQQYSASRSKKNVALGLGIAAIVIGSLFWLILIVVYSIMIKAAVDTVQTVNDADWSTGQDGSNPWSNENNNW